MFRGWARGAHCWTWGSETCCQWQIWTLGLWNMPSLPSHACHERSGAAKCRVQSLGNSRASIIGAWPWEKGPGKDWGRTQKCSRHSVFLTHEEMTQELGRQHFKRRGSQGGWPDSDGGGGKVDGESRVFIRAPL